MNSHKGWLTWGCLVLGATAPLAHAQFAVIDIGAVTQLVTQVHTLEQQLTTTRDHLVQAQAQFKSMTGGRGMERLLTGTVRNYLPSDWRQLTDLLANANASYGALAVSLKGAINANAVLTTQQLTALAPAARQQIEGARKSAALLQVLGRQALEATSNRFAAVQKLIDAIPTATDQKAILELQARIGAEQGMLQNEQTKLQTLQQSIQAEHVVLQQRVHEQIIAADGNFATRLQPVLR